MSILTVKPCGSNPMRCALFQLNFYNYLLRRIEMSAVLKTPFTNWEMTKMSYKHAGSAEKFECNAAVECSRGQHTADLKVSCSFKKEEKRPELTNGYLQRRNQTKTHQPFPEAYRADLNSPTVICSVPSRPKLTNGYLQRTEKTKTHEGLSAAYKSSSSITTRTTTKLKC